MKKCRRPTTEEMDDFRHRMDAQATALGLDHRVDLLRRRFPTTPTGPLYALGRACIGDALVVEWMTDEELLRVPLIGPLALTHIRRDAPRQYAAE